MAVNPQEIWKQQDFLKLHFRLPIGYSLADI